MAIDAELKRILLCVRRMVFRRQDFASITLPRHGMTGIIVNTYDVPSKLWSFISGKSLGVKCWIALELLNTRTAAGLSRTRTAGGGVENNPPEISKTAQRSDKR